jgi:hypothetical protein
MFTTKAAARLSFVIAASLATGTTTPAPAAAEPDPCVALDSASFDGLLGIINPGVTAAEADFKANGETGAYALAAQYSRDYLVSARKTVQDLQSWMSSIEVDATNASAAGGIHLSMTDAITALQAAAWWSLVSGSYHKSVDARTAFERASQATGRANEIGTQAGHCYLRQYLAP